MIIEACLAAALSLDGAKELFVEQCPFLERVDCDPIDGEWVCANVRLGDAAPGIPRRSGPEATLSTDTPNVGSLGDAAGRVSGRCQVDARTLGGARLAYAQQCADVRADCDPIDAGWRCASYVMNDASPMPPTATPVVSVVPSAPNPPGLPAAAALSDSGIRYAGRYGTPSLAWGDSYQDTAGRCWIRSTFDHGAGDLRVTVASGRRLTVREAYAELGPGPGPDGDLVFNDVDCGNGPANDAGDEDVNQCPGLVTRGAAGCSLRGGSWKDRL